MDLGQIISEIWNQPWYKVLIIAAADDVIFMIKIWPLYVAVIIIVILVALIQR
jgi:hypothetical protein